MTRQSVEIDVDALRDRLVRIRRRTESARALDSPGFWVGDKAGEAAVRDAWVSGRIFWKGAHDDAGSGIKYLDRGETEMALLYAWAATDKLMAALASRVRPEAIEAFAKSPGRRGRPRGAKSKKGREPAGK
jgi:hypothetical protein